MKYIMNIFKLGNDSEKFRNRLKSKHKKSNNIEIRMHSSGMRTAHSSGRRGGGLVLIPLNFPLGCGPGSDPPQFPPWVWA